MDRWSKAVKMPPEAQQAGSSASTTKKEHSSHGHKDRIGNYHVGAEIGRGSFATVYKGYRSVCHNLFTPPH